MDLKLNADRFTGREFVEIYDQFRPSPPHDLVHQALTYLGDTEPSLVVDIGCGTQQVIVVEPSDDMRAIAEKKVSLEINNIRFLKAFANEITFHYKAILGVK